MPWLSLLLFIQRPRSLKIGLVHMRTTQRQVVVVVNMDTIAAIHPLPVAAFPGSGILTPAVCNLLPFLAIFTNLCCIDIGIRRDYHFSPQPDGFPRRVNHEREALAVSVCKLLSRHWR